MAPLVVSTPAEAVAGVRDGSTILIGGFGSAGQPFALIEALRRTGARDLVVVNNNAGNGERGLAAILAAGQVRKVICSFPAAATARRGQSPYEAAFLDGSTELELVPQGTLAERIRAGGAGIAAFFTPTGAGTQSRR